MAGRQHHGMVGVARRRRNPDKRRAGEAGGKAGNHPEANAGDMERHGLIPATPEDEWIAALQAQHAASETRPLDQDLVDVALMRRGPTAALADLDELCPFSGKLQDPGIDQRVVNNVVGLRHRMQRQHGQQARIARTGAGQPHFARREIGKIGETVEDHAPRPRNRR